MRKIITTVHARDRPDHYDQDVAERCGFCCSSHLNSRFKAAFGHSPSVFRYRNPD